MTGIVTELPTYLRWEMKPNLDIRWNGTVFQTNRLGFRTPEVSLEKPADTYRIVMFGSSNTMGYGVNNKDVYTRHLERFLDAWTGPTRHVEVVNLAVAGDSPTRRLERMKKEAGRWNADWLLCDASVLDIWLEDNHVHTVVQRGLPIPFPFVAQAVERSGVTAADSLEVFREKFRDQSERVLSSVYAAWSEEASRLQIPFSIVILPRGDSKAKSPRVFQLIRELCVQNGLDYIDISAPSITWRSRSSAFPTGINIPTPGGIASCSRPCTTPSSQGASPRPLAFNRCARRRGIHGEHGSVKAVSSGSRCSPKIRPNWSSLNRDVLERTRMSTGRSSTSGHVIDGQLAPRLNV